MNENKFDEIKKEIINEIKNTDTIIIHRHQRPDPDAIGSQIGLAELIKATYSTKKVFTAGGNSSSLEFLSKMDPPAEKDYEDALILILDTANIPRIDGEFALTQGKKSIKIDHHPDEEQYGDIQWVDPTASSTSEMITDFWSTFPDELSLTDEGARHLYAGIVGDTNRFLYQGTSSKTMHLAGELMKKDFSHTKLNETMNEMSPKVAKLT
ncbi:MAG: bifunctional oligoribonuclease/PAP phosphatase NrnA, partial [Atopostipes suicloacalis]|nr:bifunctional oligoribonuclease/PAP phosphatase NrnA [Atopostipes suicloacalis]